MAWKNLKEDLAEMFSELQGEVTTKQDLAKHLGTTGQAMIVKKAAHPGQRGRQAAPTNPNARKEANKRWRKKMEADPVLAAKRRKQKREHWARKHARPVTEQELKAVELYNSGMTPKQVASTLGVTFGRVMAAIRRALHLKHDENAVPGPVS